MRTANAALAWLLVACGTREATPEPSTEQTSKPASKAPGKLDTFAITVPDGWTARYDADGDKWLFESAPLADGRTASASFEHAARQATAGPEALRHHMETNVWDTGSKADIASRKGLRDGFAVTFVVHATADPEQTRREAHVVRELGSEWFHCRSMWIPSDAIEAQVLALCTSVKRA